MALLEEPRQDLARESGVRATMIGVKPDGRRLADIGNTMANSNPSFKRFFHWNMPKRH